MALAKDRLNNWLDIYHSSVGKKIITAITGLGLVFFVLFHMMGNLLILSDREAYNQLGNWLESLSFILYAVELILLIALLFHVIMGIAIRVQARRSRDIAYNRLKSAGKPSKQSLSSVSMAITGIMIFLFLIWHLLSFKFGNYYSTMVNGVVMRDLSKLVIEKFQNPVYTFGYLGAIAFLGLHLRHGIWSAGQSLGILEGKISSVVYQLSWLLAISIFIGFAIIPLFIYSGIVNY